MKRWTRIAAYGGWFLASFLVGIYLTFPADDLRPLVTSWIEQQLGKGKQGAYGVDPKVEIGKLSLSGIGVSAQRVSVQLGSRDPDPGPVIDFDELTLGLRPWSLFSKVKTVTVNASLYGGGLDGVVSVDEKQLLHRADIEVEGVDLGKAPFIIGKLGVPVTGTLDAQVDLELGPTPEKNGAGEISLALKGVTVGPGSVPLLAAVGVKELPLIDLGNLVGKLPIVQGKGDLQGVKLDGKDVQVELYGDVRFRGKIATSRLDIDGYFHPAAALFEKAPTLKSLIELGEGMSGLGKAKDDEGRYWFGLKGSLQSPSVSLARDGGKRARQKTTSKAGGDKEADRSPDLDGAAEARGR